MFNLDKFIADSATFRPVSMFVADIEANKEKLTAEIKGKMVTRARLCRFACKEPVSCHPPVIRLFLNFSWVKGYKNRAFCAK